MARSRLGVEGVQAHLFDVEESWNTAPRIAMPVRLLVAEEDLENATTILADALRGGFALDEGD